MDMQSTEDGAEMQRPVRTRKQLAWMHATATSLLHRNSLLQPTTITTVEELLELRATAPV